MKLEQDIITAIEKGLDIVEYGEIILVIHAGEIKGVEIKSRKRILDKKIFYDKLIDKD